MRLRLVLKRLPHGISVCKLVGLGEKSPAAILNARRTVDRLTSRLSGEMVPEFGDVTIREVIEGPYRLVYQIIDSTLYVLAVIHGARMLSPDLLDRPG